MKTLFAGIENGTVKGVFSSRMAAIQGGCSSETIHVVEETLSEAQLTSIYNFLAESDIKRLRGKDKALEKIHAAFKDLMDAGKPKSGSPAEQSKKVTSGRPKPANLAVRFRDLLKKKESGYTASQAAHLLGGKVVTIKLAASHLRTGRADGTQYNINLDRKTGVYTLCK